MTDFQRQKTEAEKRAVEMNNSYRKKQNMPPVPDFVRIETPIEKEINVKPAQVKTGVRRPMDFLKMLKLDALKDDPDRLLILGLFLLLSGEETDEKLLFALLYIML